jgi:flagellar hook-basal body complex protein FliE
MNALSSIGQLSSAFSAAPLAPSAGIQQETISIPNADMSDLNAAQPAGSSSGVQPSGASFSSLLTNLVEGVNTKQNVAAQALQDLQGGQNVPLHQTMIAMEEANVSFQLMVEVRNRLLESYQELMRMQV